MTIVNFREGICNMLWWFQLFYVSTLLGEMIQFDEHIVQMGGSTTYLVKLCGYLLTSSISTPQDRFES